MLRLVIGIFLVLHGLVHLLYAGQSARLFELQEGLAWPNDSWSFAPILGDETTRTLASVTYVVLAAGFIAGGVGLLLKQGWWNPVVVIAAIGAVLFTLLFWDGKAQMLDDKGGIGLLISLAILLSMLVVQWPTFEF